ncbi:MAG: hypothetical protein E7325_04890 [Clostridiales bacterium]|nr:hypothetical protein [Clostridiales bacterium]
MAMKASGVPWIGDIPIEWIIRPVKAQYSLTTGFTPSSENDSLYDDEGETWVTISDLKSDVVIDSKQKVSKVVADQHKKELAKAGSLLYSFKLSVGTVAFAGKDLFTNEAIAAFQPISSDADLHYLKYASSLIIGNANTNIYGATIMNQKLIYNAPLPVPPLSEQQAIADYLDNRCSKIDEIIAEATASIEEYKELKQAVIFDAVTKGLDKTVLMKDSGIPWIGKMPEHWQLSRIKNECDNLDNLREPIRADNRENKLGLYDYYGASGVIDKIDDFNVDDTVLLIGEDGANLKMRNLPLIYLASGRIWVNNHAHILKVKEHRNSYMFMAYMLEAGDYNDYITGSAQPKLSQFNLMRFPIVHPPLDEQLKIEAYLNRLIPEYDALISEKQSLIYDLQAYKKSLIYEVVTGKRRVV